MLEVRLGKGHHLKIQISDCIPLRPGRTGSQTHNYSLESQDDPNTVRRAQNQAAQRHL